MPARREWKEALTLPGEKHHQNITLALHKYPSEIRRNKTFSDKPKFVDLVADRPASQETLNGLWEKEKEVYIRIHIKEGKELKKEQSQGKIKTFFLTLNRADKQSVHTDSGSDASDHVLLPAPTFLKLAPVSEEQKTATLQGTREGIQIILLFQCTHATSRVVRCYPKVDLD